RRVHRYQLDRAAALFDDADADGAGEAEVERRHFRLSPANGARGNWQLRSSTPGKSQPFCLILPAFSTEPRLDRPPSPRYRIRHSVFQLSASSCSLSTQPRT